MIARGSNISYCGTPAILGRDKERADTNVSAQGC